MTSQWMKDLTKTPGVLGCAYLSADIVISDLGDAIGGADALPVARRTAEACEEWINARNEAGLQSAVFVGERGRVLAQVVGTGMLIAFAENEASAGLLRLRLQETAERIRETGLNA